MGHLVFTFFSFQLSLFLNFLAVPNGYPDTQLSQTSQKKVIAVSFLVDERHECKMFGWHLLHSHGPQFSSGDTGGFVVIQEGLAFIWGHIIIPGMAPGKSLCKQPAFTWNLH